MKNSAKNDEPYQFSNFLLTQEPRFRPCLTALRELIRSIVPNAEETFSYQVHCFKHIYMLVGIGANREYCSLYTMSSNLTKRMKSELAACKVSGSTLHFSTEEPLPTAIITRVVMARIQENEELAMRRKKGK
ncbi:MAG: iron chaperone [Mucilaginibacter sp.]